MDDQDWVQCSDMAVYMCMTDRFTLRGSNQHLIKLVYKGPRRGEGHAGHSYRDDKNDNQRNHKISECSGGSRGWGWGDRGDHPPPLELVLILKTYANIA